MDAITSASLAMQGDLQRLTAISQNIANVATVGYRRQVPVSLEFSALLAAAGTDSKADLEQWDGRPHLNGIDVPEWKCDLPLNR